MSGPIIISGAGVMGLAVATELSDRGIIPQVVDPKGAPGPHGCSWWAGGMLAPQCEGETAEEPVQRLGAQAAYWWQHHTGLVRQQGTLVVALDRDRGELARFARRTKGHHPVQAAEIAELEPDLAGQVSKGLFFPDEAHLEPRAALQRLADLFQERGGVILPESAPSSGAGLRIDCRGLAAQDALSDLRGVKGEMVVLRSADITLSRPVRLLHPRYPLYIVPRGQGIFMLGATQIERQDRDHASARSILELLSAAYALHPAFGEAEVLEIGVDARPAFPDNLPRIRRKGDVVHVNGLFRHGFLMAPALARMVADYVETGQRPEVMDEDNS